MLKVAFFILLGASVVINLVAFIAEKIYKKKLQKNDK